MLLVLLHAPSQAFFFVIPFYILYALRVIFGIDRCDPTIGTDPAVTFESVVQWCFFVQSTSQPIIVVGTANFISPTRSTTETPPRALGRSGTSPPASRRTVVRFDVGRPLNNVSRTARGYRSMKSSTLIAVVHKSVSAGSFRDDGLSAIFSPFDDRQKPGWTIDPFSGVSGTMWYTAVIRDPFFNTPQPVSPLH